MAKRQAKVDVKMIADCCPEESEDASTTESWLSAGHPGAKGALNTFATEDLGRVSLGVTGQTVP